jgi:thiol-disulfide isomerase/thioredoxin
MADIKPFFTDILYEGVLDSTSLTWPPGKARLLKTSSHSRPSFLPFPKSKRLKSDKIMIFKLLILLLSIIFACKAAPSSLREKVLAASDVVFLPLAPELQISSSDLDKEFIGGDEARDLIEKGRKVFLFFGAHWCGYTKRALPDWQKLTKDVKKDLAGLGIRIVRMECGDDPVCSRFGVKGTPTIRYYKGNLGKHVEFPKDATDYETFKKWILENMPTVVQMENPKP